MVTFWNSLLLNKHKLSSTFYSLMLKLYDSNQMNFKWITYIKSILDDIGLSFIWNDQTPIHKDIIKSLVKQKLLDQFIQHWFSQLSYSSRGEFYSSFKKEFKLESYLLRLTKCDRIIMSKFRCSNISFLLRLEGGQKSRFKIDYVIYVIHICLETNTNIYLYAHILS